MARPTRSVVNPDLAVCGLRQGQRHGVGPCIPWHGHPVGAMACFYEASTLRRGTERDRSPGWPRRTAVSVERCHS